MKPLLLDEVKLALRAELRTPLGRGLIGGVTTDSRQVRHGELFLALRGEHFDGHAFVEEAVQAGARVVVVDRNLPLTQAMKDRDVCVMKVGDTRVALGQLARFYRQSLGHRVTVIGITGSNGKTTTREMIYHVLSKYKKGHRSPQNYNNDIGVPLTLLGVEPEHEFVVVEIASSAPGEVAALARIAEPDVAVITHVGASHLEGLKDVDGVSREKVSIGAGVKEHGVVVCCMSHKETLGRVRTLGRTVITFGPEDGADVSAVKIKLRAGQVQFETNDRYEVKLPMGGMHNVNNALGALAVTRRLGITSSQFATAMRDFAAPSGRMAYCRVGGITIIDDSYNANPESMAAAVAELESHDEAARRVLVCGDMCELGEKSDWYHQELGRTVAASKINLLLAVGGQAALTATTALDAGMGWGSVQRSKNSRRLARLIKSMIYEGDVILVKGSRAMGMEKVVESLKRFRGRQMSQTTTKPTKKKKSKIRS